MLAIGAATSVLVAAPVAATAATKVVDRTVLCEPAGIGYPESVRILGASVQPQASRGGALQPPLAYVYTPQGGEGVTAGLRTRKGSGPAYTTGAVWLDEARCRLTRPACSPLRNGP
jgi:hypothetical protein